MNEKTAAYSSLLVAVEALAEDIARSRPLETPVVTEISDAQISAIADQFGRSLTPIEVVAVKVAYSAERLRLAAPK
jgi:hypothetical protein